MRGVKRIAFEGAVSVSLTVTEPPGASHSGASVDRINGLRAGNAHEVAPVALVSVAPGVKSSKAISKGAPIACDEVFVTVIGCV